MGRSDYSPLDREVIVLAAVWDLVGSMVHYGHFEKRSEVDEIQLMFRSEECSRLFVILLADFLSYPRSGTLGLGPPQGEGSLASTYLGYLDQIAVSPNFDGDVSLLRSSVTSFAEWLDGRITVEEVWLPSIDRNGPLSVQRMTYLKICGTVSKHGFTRLGGVVNDLRKVLSDNDTNIDEGQGYLVIPEFRGWFRDNVFIASSTTIAWFLNEIRWGIYCYLRPEYERSYRPTQVVTGAQMYEYDVPAELSGPLTRSMYWDLMDEVRSPPYFPRFTVLPYLHENS